MGWKTPHCTECNVEMLPGVVLDHGHGNAITASQFHDGVPRDYKVFGFIPAGLAVEAAHIHKISGFRCPDCGFLALYAR